MKTNKKHIIIPALMMAVGVGLVGSISGTVAWYQYSTRVQAAYVGTSVKATENTQIKVESGEWQAEYTTTQLATAIASNTHNGSKMAPITTGAQAKNAALPATFKGNPIYQYAATSSWADALDTNYLQFNVSVRAYLVDGGTSTSYLNKDVFLTDLTIMDVTSGKDLSDAVRVHLHTADVDALFSKSGADTDVHGALDLNNDGVLDKSKGYEWESTTELDYGEAGVQAAYAHDDSSIVADDTDATLTGGSALGSTTDEDGLTITVTIWLEGWQKLAVGEDDNAETTDTAVWKASEYIGAQFRVGMRFAIQPVTEADLA